MNQNEEVEGFEFQAYRKDGAAIWVQENVRTVRDADGSVKYYEGTVKDITEQKQMLAALRRSECRCFPPYRKDPRPTGAARQRWT